VPGHVPRPRPSVRAQRSDQPNPWATSRRSLRLSQPRSPFGSISRRWRRPRTARAGPRLRPWLPLSRLPLSRRPARGRSRRATCWRHIGESRSMSRASARSPVSSAYAQPPMTGPFSKPAASSRRSSPNAGTIGPFRSRAPLNAFGFGGHHATPFRMPAVGSRRGRWVYGRSPQPGQRLGAGIGLASGSSAPHATSLLSIAPSSVMRLFSSMSAEPM
jgi:hypothetical protein